MIPPAVILVPFVVLQEVKVGHFMFQAVLAVPMDSRRKCTRFYGAILPGTTET